MQRKVLLAVLLMLLPVIVFSAGTIKGKVTDKASGEALVGANVSLTGTTLGAATNVNGEFTILNVPVGVYAVKATFVGYTPVTVSNVRVNNDLTTYQDFALQSEAVALQAVEIVAEKPLVNKSATNAVRIITNEDIAALPVRGLNNILALSPGVVVQDNTVYIRGGRLDEVGYYLDGVSVTNPVFGGMGINLVQDAVEEVQVQAGGYNAEFGGANSGIIQEQLRTGTPNWKASAQYTTDNIGFQPKSKAFSGSKRLGAYWYGYNEFTGTVSGPIVDERFKLFGLFDYLYNRDQNPQPYPGIHLGTLVGETGDVVNLNYPAGPLEKNSLEQYNYTGTFTADFKPITFRLAGTYSSQTSYNPYNTNRNPGPIANILDGGRIEEIDGHNGSASLKMTHLLNPTTFYELNFGYFYQDSRNLDPILRDNFMGYGDSVANAQAGVVWQRTAADIASGHVGRYIRPTHKVIMGIPFNAPGDVLAGYGKNQRQNYSITGALTTQIGSFNSVKIGGDYQRYTLRSYSWTSDQVFSLANLLNQNASLAPGDPNKLTPEQVLVNAGANTYGYDVFGNPTSGSGGVLSPKHPVFASGYVQDKIEFKDLIINAGLRYDYINTHNLAFKDPSHPEQAVNPLSGAINPAGLQEIPSFSSVSPRLGLSFPVTDQTVFHTQFGQFVQQSRLRDIYQGLYSTAVNIRGGFFIGSPVGFNVRPERTTQYELGFTQQVSDFASFDITGYYKDIKDQIVYQQQNTAPGSPLGAYYILTNGDFATTKGIELTFTMRRTKRVQVNASFTFQDAQGTGSYPNSNRGIVGAPLDNVTMYTPLYISPLEYNNAFRGNINVDYHWGRDDGGPILQELGASALITFNSGHPYTRGIGGADLEGDARNRQPVEPLNSSTTPWDFQVDLRVDKTFHLGDHLALNASIFVINLFDALNVENVFLRTGTTTDDGFLSNPSFGQPLLATYGQDYAALYRALNIDYQQQYLSAPFLSTVPYFYGPPRQIRFGLRLEY